MSAYYNEFDSKKAVWLRELISRGLIAPGEVDERSIVDVQPDDLRGFTQCHFFAGIGIWSHALRLAGWENSREAWTGSCPCQPFSAAGKGEAFNDERHLWPEFFRLIQARRPVVCFGEQVASVDGLTWLDTVQSDLDDADYTCGAVDICAAGFGAPHRRQRLYWVAHTESGGHQGQPLRARGRLPEDGTPQACVIGGMADANGPDSSAERLQRSRELGQQSEDGRDVPMAGDGVGDSKGIRRRRRQDINDSGRRQCAPGQTSETVRLDHAASNGRQYGETVTGSDGAGAEQAGCWIEPSDRGPVNGFWSGSDWVLTRPQRVGDRPGLRPVERGAFPLAHGSPARVGRLRGYGDGIVVQAAQAFIESYRSITE